MKPLRYALIQVILCTNDFQVLGCSETVLLRERKVLGKTMLDTEGKERAVKELLHFRSTQRQAAHH